MLIDNYKVAAAERGTVTKHPKYLLIMQLRTAKTLRPEHPINHGVPMQAHHALSAKGIDLSDLGEKLEDFGYDINDFENLVYIPSTLPGACLLNIQPHRGDHKASSPTGHDDDASRDATYHTRVSSAVKDTFRTIGATCGTDMSKVKAETKTAMDKLSAQFIKFIQKKPGEYRLTRVSENYNAGNPIGCGGRESVSDTPMAQCPVHRKHTGTHGIKFVYDEPYILKPGN
jgi:hypothetical protein